MLNWCNTLHSVDVSLCLRSRKLSWIISQEAVCSRSLLVMVIISESHSTREERRRMRLLQFYTQSYCFILQFKMNLRLVYLYTCVAPIHIPPHSKKPSRERAIMLQQTIKIILEFLFYIVMLMWLRHRNRLNCLIFHSSQENLLMSQYDLKFDKNRKTFLCLDNLVTRCEAEKIFLGRTSCQLLLCFHVIRI